MLGSEWVVELLGRGRLSGMDRLPVVGGGGQREDGWIMGTWDESAGLSWRALLCFASAPWLGGE
jgi:hypothetical protein